MSDWRWPLSWLFFLLLLDGEVGDVVTVLLEDEAVVFGDAEARFGS